jgi:hypothetical protein
LPPLQGLASATDAAAAGDQRLTPAHPHPRTTHPGGCTRARCSAW